MTRIEVREYDQLEKVIADHTTEDVISITKHPGYKKITFGQSASGDGRTFCIIPATFEIVDITINKPRDLFMVTIKAL